MHARSNTSPYKPSPYYEQIIGKSEEFVLFSLNVSMTKKEEACNKPSVSIPCYCSPERATPSTHICNKEKTKQTEISL